MKKWIVAFRLRSLPLAFSCILLGSFLALFFGVMKLEVLLLALLTTFFLQILSNLANDYGDAESGVDSKDRLGPKRSVQSGEISEKEMLNAIWIFGILSLLSGITLLFFSLKIDVTFVSFLLLGLLAIIAAIKYTVGKTPYGYVGLGDISVFIFFGIVGVVGTFFLHTSEINSQVFLPAVSCGLLSTAVLNVNNIRDITSDQLAGKRSIPVRIGRKNAVIYHFILILLAWVSIIIFTLKNYNHPIQWIFVVTFPLFIKNVVAISTLKEEKAIDPYLKQLALSTFAFTLLFSIGLWLSKSL